jgi:hypothetical protein
MDPLAALIITDNQGISHEYSYEQFFKIPAQEFSTSKEVDGETVINTWKGIRFDTWLKEQNLGDFAVIKFLSGDRYEVKFNKAEWDTLTCFLAHTGEGNIFPNEQLRIIFPHLRSMYWVRDVKRISLEHYKEIPIPVKFYSLAEFLSKQELVQDPKPFVKMKGYRFDDFVGKLSDLPIKDVVIYSRDGLIQTLVYPSQLAGAVLELTEEGTYNVKSPQIPGGMWMKNISYIQVDYQALIDTYNASVLVPLAKALQWQLSPNVKLNMHFPRATEVMELGDVLAEPMLLNDTLYFELVP